MYIQHLTFIQCVQLFVALLGLIQIIKSICTFLKAFYSKLYNHGLLKEERYLYHFTRFQDEIEFREYKLRFEINWKNRIIMKVTDLSKHRHDYIKYKGIVKNEDSQVIFKLETENKNLFNAHDKGKEEVQIRFYNSSLLTEKIVYGIWIGKDLNKRPICGVRIMSSEKLTESEVKELIKDRAITNKGFGMLSIMDIDNVNFHTSTNQKADLQFGSKPKFKEVDFEELHKDGKYYSKIGESPLSVEQYRRDI